MPFTICFLSEGEESHLLVNETLIKLLDTSLLLLELKLYDVVAVFSSTFSSMLLVFGRSGVAAGHIALFLTAGYLQL